MESSDIDRLPDHWALKEEYVDTNLVINLWTSVAVYEPVLDLITLI